MVFLFFAALLSSCSILSPRQTASHLLSDQQRFLQASARGDVELAARLLKEGAQIDDGGSGGTTALMTASFRGHRKFVDFLLTQNASLEIRDEIGQTALHHAAIGGQGEIVSALLSAGASPEPVSALGLTPIMLAARVGDLESVSRLLAAGADPAATEPTGWNTYFFAVSRGNRAIFDRLLHEHPPSLSHQDVDGQTLVHIAVLYRQPEIYRDLLRLKPDLRIRNKDGKTAKDLAREANLAGR